MNLRFKNESGIIRVLKHCAPLHTEQDLEDMGGNNFVFFFFFGPCIFNNEDKNKPTKCKN